MDRVWNTAMDESEAVRRALDGGDVDADGLERVRRRLRAEIDRELHPRRRRWPPLIAAAVAAAVVALGITVMLPTSREAAATELRRLGAIAGTQDPVRPGPGQYLLIRSEQLRRESFTTIGVDGSFDLITRLDVSTWVATDGSAFKREEVLSTTFASGADRQAWIEAGRPDLTLPRSSEYPPGEGPIHDVSTLPDEPDALLRALRSGATFDRPPGDAQAFIVVGELLAQGVAPPQLRAALFEVTARLEGVVLIGTVDDPLGRPGTAVELATVNSHIRLIFDPDSAQLLATVVYATNVQGDEELASWTAARPTVIVEEAPRLDD
jgi:hypothetical protein